MRSEFHNGFPPSFDKVTIHCFFYVLSLLVNVVRPEGGALKFQLLNLTLYTAKSLSFFFPKIMSGRGLKAYRYCPTLDIHAKRGLYFEKSRLGVT